MDVFLMGIHTYGLVIRLLFLFGIITLYSLLLMHISSCNRDVGKTITKVYTIYLILEHMNTLHSQMAEATVSKLEHTISHWKVHQVSCIRFVHLHKIHLKEVAFMWYNYNGFVVASFYKTFV